MSKKIDSSELNYDMNYNLFLLKTAMPNLKTTKGKYIAKGRINYYII